MGNNNELIPQSTLIKNLFPKSIIDDLFTANPGKPYIILNNCAIYRTKSDYEIAIELSKSRACITTQLYNGK